jgi:hypothetical protein
MRRVIAAIVLVVLALAGSGPASAQAPCQFVLGFAALRAMIPTQVGTCLEDQQTNVQNGDSFQRTTGGMLVWRKADNWTAFTDGYRTWLNGPLGLQQRLNTDLFSWEGVTAGGAAAVPDAPPAPPAAAPAATAAAAATRASPAGAAAASADPAAPVLAWYYPQYSQGLATDVRNAAAAGIDALIVSETGASDLAPFLDAARGTGVRIALGVEPGYDSPDALAGRIGDVIARHGTDAGYLRFRGRPVFVFWNLPSVPLIPGQSAPQTWAAVRQRADPARTSLWIGEGADPNSIASYLPAFDAWHLYSIAWAADPRGQLAAWADRVRRADSAKLWVATVMPGGYYGSGTDRAQWQYRERAGGAFYRTTWDGAIASRPAMVIITSFNETNERTEIHPTAEWATLYLDITREKAAAWRG